MVESSASQSPPSLRFSPAVSDHDHRTTRESTPAITTPVGCGVSSRSPNKKDDSRSDWPQHPVVADSVDRSSHQTRLGLDIAHSDYSADEVDFPIFPFSPPTSSGMMASATPIDIATRQTSVSPPGQQASNLTSALQRASNGERNGSMSHASGVGISVFKAPPPRKDSVGTGSAQWGGGSKPISVTGSNRDRSRRESLAGSLVGQMSWGGVSVGSWIRDE